MQLKMCLWQGENFQIDDKCQKQKHVANMVEDSGGSSRFFKKKLATSAQLTKANCMTNFLDLPPYRITIKLSGFLQTSKQRIRRIPMET